MSPEQPGLLPGGDFPPVPCENVAVTVPACYPSSVFIRQAAGVGLVMTRQAGGHRPSFGTRLLPWRWPRWRGGSLGTAVELHISAWSGFWDSPSWALLAGSAGGHLCCH